MTNNLITKYRPTKFDDVIGQEAAVRALKTALKKKNIHAFLFTGPSGVGKTTLARLMARAVNCADADIIEIDAATHTGIDAMREIASTIYYAPIGQGSKAIIVDECHALSRQAVQSILKAIEEPPEWGYWMLCTTELNKVPVTIRNRCLHLALRPVPKQELVDWLTGIAKLEKYRGPYIKDIINLCAVEAQGSPRQALTYLAACAGSKSVDEAREMMQAVAEEKQAIDLARALMKGARWRDLKPILEGLKDQNAESIRQIVRAYMTTVALKAEGQTLRHALRILEAFSTPCNPQDGITPIVIACGKLYV